MSHRAASNVTVVGPAGKLMVTQSGGGGLPILFVHDNAADRTHWSAAQADLRTHTVAFDLRGLGESGGSHGPFGVEAGVEDVAAIADALLPGRFLLAGHGFGAAVAGAFAAYYPERVAGLLYVEAPGDLRHTPPADREAWLGNFALASYGNFHEHWLIPMLNDAKPTTRSLVLKTLRTSRREAIAGYVEALYHWDPGETFTCFAGHTHALAASTGPQTLVAQFPKLSRSVVPHASHWLMLDAPEWFHGELMRFLGQCRH